MGNFFNFKDMISLNIKSNIVHKYSCSLCSATYLCESIRHFHTLVSEHKGISPRKGVPYTKHRKTNMCQHYQQTGLKVSASNIKIVFFSGRQWETKLGESILMHQFKPSFKHYTACLVVGQNIDRQNVATHNVEQTKCRRDKMSTDKTPNRQNVDNFFFFFNFFFWKKKISKEKKKNLLRFSVTTLFRS